MAQFVGHVNVVPAMFEQQVDVDSRVTPRQKVCMRRIRRKEPAALADFLAASYQKWLDDKGQEPIQVTDDERGTPIRDFLRDLIDRGIENEWAFVKFLLEKIPEIVMMLMQFSTTMVDE